VCVVVEVCLRNGAFGEGRGEWEGGREVWKETVREKGRELYVRTVWASDIYPGNSAIDVAVIDV
jgi:hypothetical protein